MSSSKANEITSTSTTINVTINNTSQTKAQQEHWRQRRRPEVGPSRMSRLLASALVLLLLCQLTRAQCPWRADSAELHSDCICDFNPSQQQVMMSGLPVVNSSSSSAADDQSGPTTTNSISSQPQQQQMRVINRMSVQCAPVDFGRLLKALKQTASVELPVQLARRINNHNENEQQPQPQQQDDNLEEEQLRLVSQTKLDLLHVSNSTIRVLRNNTFIMDTSQLFGQQQQQQHHQIGQHLVVAIQSLHLSRCGIETIEAGAFNGLDWSLASLSLADNYLESIPDKALRHLANLKVLDLSNNNIKSLGTADTFKYLNKLNTLRLADNRLIGRQQQQQQLGDGSGDSAAAAQQAAFAGLETSLVDLNLKNTQLNEWPQAIGKLRNLAFLNLAQNQISQIPREAFRSMNLLTAINLERNRISTIDEDTFVGLEASLSSLSLLGNLIESYPVKQLAKLSGLRRLDLGFNRMEYLPLDSFEFNRKLLLIALDGNPLETLPEQTFKPLEGSLRGLSVGGRSLNCDCRLSWMLRWQREHNIQISSRERAPQFCAKPHYLRSLVSFAALKPEHLTCNYNTPTVMTTTTSMMNSTPFSGPQTTFGPLASSQPPPTQTSWFQLADRWSSQQTPTYLTITTTPVSVEANNTASATDLTTQPMDLLKTTTTPPTTTTGSSTDYEQDADDDDGPTTTTTTTASVEPQTDELTTEATSSTFASSLDSSPMVSLPDDELFVSPPHGQHAATTAGRRKLNRHGYLAAGNDLMRQRPTASSPSSLGQTTSINRSRPLTTGRPSRPPPTIQSVFGDRALTTTINNNNNNSGLQAASSTSARPTTARVITSTIGHQVTQARSQPQPPTLTPPTLVPATAPTTTTTGSSIVQRQASSSSSRQPTSSPTTRRTPAEALQKGSRFVDGPAEQTSGPPPMVAGARLPLNHQRRPQAPPATTSFDYTSTLADIERHFNTQAASVHYPRFVPSVAATTAGMYGQTLPPVVASSVTSSSEQVSRSTSDQHEEKEEQRHHTGRTFAASHQNNTRMSVSSIYRLATTPISTSKPSTTTSTTTTTTSTTTTTTTTSTTTTPAPPVTITTSPLEQQQHHRHPTNVMHMFNYQRHPSPAIPTTSNTTSISTSTSSSRRVASPKQEASSPQAAETAQTAPTTTTTTSTRMAATVRIVDSLPQTRVVQYAHQPLSPASATSPLATTSSTPKPTTSSLSSMTVDRQQVATAAATVPTTSVDFRGQHRVPTTQKSLLNEDGDEKDENEATGKRETLEKAASPQVGLTTASNTSSTTAKPSRVTLITKNTIFDTTTTKHIKQKSQRSDDLPTTTTSSASEAGSGGSGTPFMENFGLRLANSRVSLASKFAKLADIDQVALIIAGILCVSIFSLAFSAIICMCCRCSWAGKSRAASAASSANRNRQSQHSNSLQTVSPSSFGSTTTSGQQLAVSSKSSVGRSSSLAARLFCCCFSSNRHHSSGSRSSSGRQMMITPIRSLIMHDDEASNSSASNVAILKSHTGGQGGQLEGHNHQLTMLNGAKNCPSALFLAGHMAPPPMTGKRARKCHLRRIQSTATSGQPAARLFKPSGKQQVASGEAQREYFLGVAKTLGRRGSRWTNTTTTTATNPNSEPNDFVHLHQQQQQLFSSTKSLNRYEYEGDDGEVGDKNNGWLSDSCDSDKSCSPGANKNNRYNISDAHHAYLAGQQIQASMFVTTEQQQRAINYRKSGLLKTIERHHHHHHHQQQQQQQRRSQDIPEVDYLDGATGSTSDKSTTDDSHAPLNGSTRRAFSYQAGHQPQPQPQPPATCFGSRPTAGGNRPSSTTFVPTRAGAPVDGAGPASDFLGEQLVPISAEEEWPEPYNEPLDDTHSNYNNDRHFEHYIEQAPTAKAAAVGASQSLSTNIGQDLMINTSHLHQHQLGHHQRRRSFAQTELLMSQPDMTTTSRVAHPDEAYLANWNTVGTQNHHHHLMSSHRQTRTSGGGGRQHHHYHTNQHHQQHAPTGGGGANNWLRWSPPNV